MDRRARTRSAVRGDVRPRPPHAYGSHRRRLARVFAFAWVGVPLSACAHASVTGAALPPAVIAAAGALAAGAMAPLAGRRLSVPLGAGALAALQAGLHLFFTVLTPPERAPHALAGASLVHPAAPHPYVAAIPTVPMLCGHLLAATALSWLLHDGELAAERLCDLGRPRVTGALRAALDALRVRPYSGQCPPPAPADQVSPPPCRHTPAPGREAVLAHEVTRRGPPEGAAALG